MDLLTTVEPQLALPVVGVVVCALLVYLFGFQQTQEPSFEHLAVLQSGNKTAKAVNGVRSKVSTPQIKLATKPKEKIVTNGHVIQEKPSPKANGVAKSPKSVKEVPISKENVKAAKKSKTASDPAEDLNQGDWIQAVSRKDRKTKVEKSKKDTHSPQTENVILKEETVVVEAIAPAKAEIAATNAKVAEKSPKGKKGKLPVVVEKQTTIVEKPAEEVVVLPTKTLTIEEAIAQFNQKGVTTLSAPTIVSAPTNKSAVSEKSAPKTSIKENPDQKSKDSNPEPKSNVAFDEMGDAWEEAKSRGTKKRRARKD